MAAFNKFNCFARDLAKGVHDLSTDTFKIRLTNAAPGATMDLISCITTIATGNGWATDVALAIADATATVATYAVFFTDVTIDNSAGADPCATFRYVVVYNDTPATPGDYVTDPLVGWYDYGTAVVLSSGEKFVIDFDSTQGCIRVA